MPFDYSKAESHAALLKDTALMRVFTEINRAAGQYFSDSTRRENDLRNYCERRKIDLNKELGKVTNDLVHVTEIHGNNGFDVTARENMMRLAMKEVFLDAALNSGAVHFGELADLETITSGVVTNEHVADLRRLGFPKLSGIAAMYVK